MKKNLIIINAVLAGVWFLLGSITDLDAVGDGVLLAAVMAVRFGIGIALAWLGMPMPVDGIEPRPRTEAKS